jgi:hypothetical protein
MTVTRDPEADLDGCPYEFPDSAQKGDHANVDCELALGAFHRAAADVPTLCEATKLDGLKLEFSA